METRYCDSCPEVVIGDDGYLSISEAERRARLTARKGNVLVEAIRSGELTKLPSDGERRPS